MRRRLSGEKDCTITRRAASTGRRPWRSSTATSASSIPGEASGAFVSM